MVLNDAVTELQVSYPGFLFAVSYLTFNTGFPYLSFLT